jgi:CrcB protein
MTPFLLVALGGAVGSAGRYALVTAVSRDAAAGAFPLGTFLVNLAGCFAIGLLAGTAERAAWLATDVRLFVMTGILGGFTTFSAFGLETFALLRRGDSQLALTYAGTSVLIGVAFVAAGFALTAGSGR